MIQVIKTDTAPKAIGPYSQAVAAHGFLFVSGQVAFDPQSGQFLNGSIEEQSAQVLKNLEAILVAANSSFKQVVKTTVFLKDMNDFTAMNAVYEKYFPEHKPARATIEVARLPRDAKIEIELVALT